MDQTPNSQTSPKQRPRSRGFSFRSDQSNGSGGKEKHGESPKDKQRRDSIWKGTSKANPNAAINEAQPAVANAIEESTLQNLREYQHKDTHGNIIADPDRSNPTRPRLERPLETIRSFEKAIDNGYKRRSSHMRQDSEAWDKNNQYASRPTSYFGGGEYMQPDRNRRRANANAPAGYDNGNRFSQAGGGGYYANQSGYNGPPRAARTGRNMQADPPLYGQQRPYPQHGHQQSHDTVNTGMTNGSDSTGPWANSTDPSSENSSIDKAAAMNKPTTPMNGYGNHGSDGYNGPIMEEQGGYSEYPQQNGYGQPYGYPPQNGYGRPNGAPPVQAPNGSRRPIPLSDSAGMASMQSGNLPPAQRKEPEKRKSWLKRRFSKSK